MAAAFYVFRPFITDIAIAAILVTIFYKPYLKLTSFLKGHKHIASFLMCLFLLILIILPTVNLVAYTANKSVQAYSEAVVYFEDHNLSDVVNLPIVEKLNLESVLINAQGNDVINNMMLDFFKTSSNWMISGAKSLVVGTTNFMLSLVIIILTMYFLFVDGRKMVDYLMYLLPLKDKYNKEIFKKFHEISYTTMTSTFVVAIVQGVVGAIGFAIVGFPAFLAGVIVAILSLFPVVGSALFYAPMGLYYLIIGQTWQGIFILCWGFFIIGTIDNIIRAWMIKDKAQVNPIFVVLSVLGGITLFGFWGVVLGPLVVSLLVTMLHIYSLEFAVELEADNKNYEPMEPTPLPLEFVMDKVLKKKK